MAEVERSREDTLEQKLGLILVEIHLMNKAGVKISQKGIRQRLSTVPGAPPLTNIDYPMKFLIQDKKPELTARRPNGEAWLTRRGGQIEFTSPETVLSDYRACDGLLYAHRKATYNGSAYIFKLNDLNRYLIDKFGITGRLTQLFLEDYRACGYTTKIENSSDEERIHYQSVVNEMFYLSIAAESSSLVKEY